MNTHAEQNEQTQTEGILTHLTYPTVLLGVAALIATSLLALGHLSTRDAIAERKAEDLQRSLAEVIPPSIHDNDLTANTLEIPTGEKSRTVYRAERDGLVTGVAFKITAPDGYGGPMEMVLGLNPAGELLGVRVLAHTETPGLGDKIELSKSDWILSFNGRSLANQPQSAWAVKKEGGQFDQFTGATITPRAVIKAVKQGLDFYAEHQLQLTRTAKTESQ